MKKFKLFAVAITVLLVGTLKAQGPSYGTSGFNDQNYDQVPFASGVAYPSVMTATNVAASGWNFHIGALGTYVITQVDHGSSSYDGAITASNVTPAGPAIYQTFGFSTPSLTKFKLNSVKVKIINASASPLPMLLAGVVGTSAGSVQPFLAMPGSNWYTLTTSANPNFAYINGVLVINGDGTTSVSPYVTEMAIDDIDISAPTSSSNLPVFTTQPVSQTVCTTGTTSFTGTATNAASYFWLMSTDNLIWNPINASNAGTTFSGYNTNTLTVTHPSSSLNNLYLMVTAVNSTGGNQSSYPARLYVNTISAGTIIGGNSVCVGSNLSLSNPTATSGGTWSITAGRATISTLGVVTGTSAGSTTVKYSVGSGSCAASTTLAFTVNALPVVPTISFAPGTTNISSGIGGYCKNKTFTLVGSPSGGSWSSTGVISISAGGVVNTNSSTGACSVKYTYTNSNNCTNSRTISSTIVACRGINSSKVIDDNFVVYPNPTRNVVNINLKNVMSNTVATVYNLMGKQVKTQTLSLGNNSIDVSALAKGIYTISIANGESIKTQKIIVE